MIFKGSWEKKTWRGLGRAGVSKSFVDSCRLLVACFNVLGNSDMVS